MIHRPASVPSVAHDKVYPGPRNGFGTLNTVSGNPAAASTAKLAKRLRQIMRALVHLLFECGVRIAQLAGHLIEGIRQVLDFGTGAHVNLVIK